MGWIIVVFVIIVILIVSIVVNFRKKAKKIKPKDVIRQVIEPPDLDISLTPNNQIEELIENSPKDARLTPRIRKPITTYPLSKEQQKSYVRYDWQKIFEDSIVSPFPEDSTALPFLMEANKLEREGANPIIIEEALAEARRLDPEACDLYLARWSIIKKHPK